MVLLILKRPQSVLENGTDGGLTGSFGHGAVDFVTIAEPFGSGSLLIPFFFPNSFSVSALALLKL